MNIIVNLIYTNEGVIPGAKSCPNTQATFDVGRDIILGSMDDFLKKVKLFLRNLYDAKPHAGPTYLVNTYFLSIWLLDFRRCIHKRMGVAT